MQAKLPKPERVEPAESHAEGLGVLILRIWVSITFDTFGNATHNIST